LIFIMISMGYRQTQHNIIQTGNIIISEKLYVYLFG